MIWRSAVLKMLAGLQDVAGKIFTGLDQFCVDVIISVVHLMGEGRSGQ